MPTRRADALPYAELHCLTHFTFLRGASHPGELIERAQALGYTALAITDECSVAGVVRAQVALRKVRESAAKEAAVPGATAPAVLKLIIGAEFRLDCGLKFVALAMNRQGYGRLCSLITCGRRAAPKGEYLLTRADVETCLQQCLILWLPEREPQREAAQWLQARFPGNVWIAVELFRDGADREHLEALRRLGLECDLPLVASGDVHMHVRERRRLQDALTAIRCGVPLTETGLRLYPNGERHLREPARLARLYPAALLAQTLVIAERCSFSLDELKYEYPQEILPAGETPHHIFAQARGAGNSQALAPGHTTASARHY